MPQPSAHQEHEEEDGELWLASLADLFSLLFGFFVMMFAISVPDEKKFQIIADSMTQTFRSVQKGAKETNLTTEQEKLRAFQMLMAVLNVGHERELSSKIENAYIEEKKLETAKEAVKERIDNLKSSGLEVLSPKEKKDTYVELVLPNSLLFNLNNDNLSKEGEKIIREVAAILQDVAQVTEVIVVGHAQKYASAKNTPLQALEFSANRAHIVANLLISQGVPERILSISAKGHNDPLFPELDENGKLLLQNQEKNNRVQIILKRPGAT